MGRVWALGFLLAGCAAPPTVAPEAPSSTLPTASSDTASAEAPPARSPKLKRCHVPAPKPLAQDEISEGGTCVDHRAEEKRIRPILLKRFNPTVKGGTVEVAFGCDPVSSDPMEIIVETGSGHGGSLSVWWIRSKIAGGDFEVTQFVHSSVWAPYDKYDYTVADRFKAQTLRGTLSASTLEKVFKRAMPALTATFRELEPPPEPNSLHGMSMSSSSHDFHAAVSVTNGYRRLARRFTGYEGTGGQDEYLGINLALESIRPMLEQIKTVEAPIDEAERAFFVKHVRSVAPRFYDTFNWWVRERYLHLAARFDAKDLVPFVMDDLRHGLGEVAKRPETDRNERAINTVGDSINGMVRLTGFDPRYDADKKPRPAVEVAQEILEECSP
jgi:hypothetical protein